MPSRRLGIAQLAISNYLHSKRGKAMQNLLRRDEEVMMLVDRLAKAIYKNESITQKMVCEIWHLSGKNAEVLNGASKEFL